MLSKDMGSSVIIRLDKMACFVLSGGRNGGGRICNNMRVAHQGALTVYCVGQYTYCFAEGTRVCTCGSYTSRSFAIFDLRMGCPRWRHWK